jgi:quercetin dioxygenase-like cupin family protein
MSYTRRQFAAFAGGAFAKAAEPQRIWNPDRIRWQREEEGGARYAVLEGDRERPGEPFTYAFWMPSGLWVKAHTHTQQAHVTVVRGALLLGYGTKMDRSKAERVPAGGFFIVRAGEAHYEGAGGDTLIIGTALGGWKTKMLE